MMGDGVEMKQGKVTLVLLYITAGSEAEARQIGQTLVAEKRVACVNLRGPHTAIYRWQGVLHEDAEWSLLAKTTADQVESVIARIKALHSYDVPCIVALPISDGLPAFMEWAADQVEQV